MKVYGTAPYPVLIIALILLLPACSSGSHRHAGTNGRSSASVPVSETNLLDVTISILEPGLNDNQITNRIKSSIRAAEAIYIPCQLARALSATEKWGAVRVLPANRNSGDIVFTGKVVHSDSDRLELDVLVKDASGKTWIDKRYSGTADITRYQGSAGPYPEPFKQLYDLIVHDLLAQLENLDAGSISTIRTISELDRAHRFVPQISKKYLAYGQNGHIRIRHLPSEADPNIVRLRKLQRRNDMFLDTLQSYYTSFASRMNAPYFAWRKETHHEKSALEGLRGQSRNQFMTGMLTVFSSLIPFSKRNFLRPGRTGGDSNPQSAAVGIASGTELLEQSLDKSEQSKIHEIALQELGESLASDIEPIRLSVEAQAVSLTGSVEEQFSQWEQILRKIYNIEFGIP